MKVLPLVIAPLLVGSGLAGYFVGDHRSAGAASAPASDGSATEVANAAALPPDHPAVPGRPHATGMLPNAENQRPPSIDWTVPPTWQSLPNANPMRLATYRAEGGAEATVARAGGPIDSNILRWSQQFAEAPAPERDSKTVRGLRVTVVHLRGTYSGGMGTTTPETHDGWAMRAAIVEAPGAPYFFKILGPAADVDRARQSFDAVVDSVTPKSAP